MGFKVRYDYTLMETPTGFSHQPRVAQQPWEFSPRKNRPNAESVVSSEPLRERLQIQPFHLASGPGGFAEELEGGFHRGVILEALDVDAFSKPIPTVMFLQLGDHLLQGDAVKRVVGLFLTHGFNLATKVFAYNPVDPYCPWHDL